MIERFLVEVNSAARDEGSAGRNAKDRREGPRDRAVSTRLEGSSRERDRGIGVETSERLARKRVRERAESARRPFDPTRAPLPSADSINPPEGKRLVSRRSAPRPTGEREIFRRSRARSEASRARISPAYPSSCDASRRCVSQPADQLVN